MSSPLYFLGVGCLVGAGMIVGYYLGRMFQWRKDDATIDELEQMLNDMLRVVAASRDVLTQTRKVLGEHLKPEPIDVGSNGPWTDIE